MFLRLNCKTTLLSLLLCLLLPLWGDAVAASKSDDVVSKSENALGLGEGDLQRQKVKEVVPHRIAIMPATGEGEHGVREDIRTAIHNHLSSLTFDVIKPFIIDSRITRMQEQGLAVDKLSPEELATRFDVNGLLYLHVDKVEKLYVAAYAHYKINITASLYSAKDKKIIWKSSQSVVERAGGISLNPLGILATAITSASILGDSVRIMLTDKLGREIAALIPTPKGRGDVIAPPKLFLASSNAVEGPFGMGMEVKVGAKAEPGLIVTVDLGDKLKKLPLLEVEKGKYIASIVVKEGYDAQKLVPHLLLINPKSRSRLEWDIPGRIDIDTVPPEQVQHVMANPLLHAIQLSWQPLKQSGGNLKYLVERLSQNGEVTAFPKTAVSTFTDNDVVIGETYHYRITAIDSAGNRGLSAPVAMMAMNPGPTKISGLIEVDAELYSFGSPYMITGSLRVMPKVTLLVHAGVFLQLNEHSKFEVLGALQVDGDKKNPVHIEGDGWELKFKSGQRSLLKYLKVSGAHTKLIVDGKVDIQQSSFTGVYQPEPLPTKILHIPQNIAAALSLHTVDHRKMKKGLSILSGAQLKIDHVLVQGYEIGLFVDGGKLSAADSRFLDNEIGLWVQGNSHLSSEKLRFANNRVHAKSSLPLRLDRSFFAENNFLSLLGKVQGKAKINWKKSVTGEDDRQTWLMQQVRQFGSKIATEGFPAAALEMNQTLQAISGEDSQFIKEVLETLRSGTLPRKHQAASATALKLFLNKHYHKDKQLKFWLQEVDVGLSASTTHSNLYMRQRADSKLKMDFMRNRLPGVSPFKYRRLARSIDIASYTPLTFLLYNAKDRSRKRGWFLRATYNHKIDPLLVQEGLIKRPPSNVLISLLAKDSSVVSALLREKNLRVDTLIGNAVNKEAFAQAAMLGSQLLIQVVKIAQQGKSGLSSRLVQVSGRIELGLYDVKKQVNIKSFYAESSGVGFSENEAEGKMMKSAVKKIENELLNTLFAYDSKQDDSKK
ncbi:MAG: fibronectin type III domain-containing protein [Mariprofundus sp.]|nr:fibronectin type III domain-containing protein [Mariprofundus sp.]